uniref:Leupaxin n=1 Tax=Athene cunicularia TaxID=194338 RepID=A0A663M3E7_ATHCN
SRPGPAGAGHQHCHCWRLRRLPQAHRRQGELPTPPPCCPSPLGSQHPLELLPQVGAHPDAFPAGFHERGGKPYCRQDFLAMFAPKCQGCERPVTDNYLSALQGVWHPECFVCAECLSGFASGSFFELEGRPYCELHFHQRQGNICHGCGHPVTGRCITAMGRKYHPEHFICAYCLGQLQKGTFRERGDKMYCQPNVPRVLPPSDTPGICPAEPKAPNTVSAKPEPLASLPAPFPSRHSQPRPH